MYLKEFLPYPTCAYYFRNTCLNYEDSIILKVATFLFIMRFSYRPLGPIFWTQKFHFSYIIFYTSMLIINCEKSQNVIHFFYEIFFFLNSEFLCMVRNVDDNFKKFWWKYSLEIATYIAALVFICLLLVKSCVTFFRPQIIVVSLFHLMAFCYKVINNHTSKHQFVVLVMYKKM